MPIEILSSLSLYFDVLTLQIQCIRNWSGLSAAECPITGDVFCAASNPGIASDRLWPTRSRATTIRSRRIHIRFPVSSSARPCPVLRQGNHSLLRQISESADGLLDNPSRAEEREGRAFPIRGVRQVVPEDT